MQIASLDLALDHLGLLLFRLSLRFVLGLTLVVVNIGLTAVVATFAYQAAHDAMVDQALNSVALVSQSRERELRELLARRQERLEGFLESLEMLCAERNPSGTLGFEVQCRRAAVGGLHRSERALTTIVSYRNRQLAVFGGRVPAVEAPRPGYLAHIDSVAGRGTYAMRAARGQLRVDVEFPLDDVNAIFHDPAGLEGSGEAFLTDALGYRLTSAAGAHDVTIPVRMSTVDDCLNGENATRRAEYGGVSVISGVRRTGLAGGGCIVANVTYADATMPVRRLGVLLAYTAALIGVLGGVISAIAAGLVTRPIKRLAVVAHALGEGQLDAPVPISGTSEVRQLATTLSRMSASIRDLVQRERTARRHAEAASRTKDDFLATLSHELRTPLNAILGWASILTRTDYDRSRVAHAVRVIERNARLQSQMVEELLDVSRIATGRVRLNIAHVPVVSALDAAIEAARPAADAKGIALRHHVDVTLKTFRADPRRLQQIIWNLLSNAVRFTSAGGWVELVARDADPGFVELVVSDNGCGIAPAFLPHVFERFRQADSSTTRTHGGLGLGLAIVHDLVEMHGGTVRVESEGENKGTTFTVRLPATAGNIHEGVQSRTGLGPTLTGTSVLVVDDDPDSREVLRTILEDAGARVTTSASARETRELFAETHPDLLIADVGMPEEDGYSLIESVRRMEGGSDVPAIALTAHTRPEDIERALASGFQMHMAKPVDSIRLVASAASLVIERHA